MKNNFAQCTFLCSELFGILRQALPSFFHFPFSQICIVYHNREDLCCFAVNAGFCTEDGSVNLIILETICEVIIELSTLYPVWQKPSECLSGYKERCSIFVSELKMFLK